MKLTTAILFFILGQIAFASSSDFKVSVVPKNPVMVTTGSATISGQAITTPYFILNSLRLDWKSTHDLMVTSIVIASHDSSFQVGCKFSPERMSDIFPASDAHGHVVLSAGGATLIGGPAVCSGFNLPTPSPLIFKIPITITVFGAVLNNAGQAIDYAVVDTEATVQ